MALVADARTSKPSRPMRGEEAEKSRHARRANAGGRSNLRSRCRIDTAALAEQQIAFGLQLFLTDQVIRSDEALAIGGSKTIARTLRRPAGALGLPAMAVTMAGRALGPWPG
ncbi:hypothetical protein I3J27_06025 [Bradyrhizobium xenonodulans]|uniref:Uncharacterized protein n=1 Tax=Bradyrhizobium xenonodulans TaxID=2736875 RepID=A0ABY7MNM2_9BRAD|nr:hypothetical protein [Bradyrhizobium xenonodulans]WBL79985.1 hypothetical protein I3J27_06025 [Bradyrhizobium xenonodulans]